MARREAVARCGTGLLAGLVLVATMAGSGPVRAGDAANPAVVELFTSQGCSSCPAADELLGELAKRQDIIALSMPVDYWDYLGWRDTLASHEFTERQRAYANARGDGQVYTPQVVINGTTHAVGSRIDDIEAAVAATADKLGPWRSGITLRTEGDELVIEIGQAPAGATVADGRVLVAMTSRSVDVPIATGENRGKTITYYNVVRRLSEIGKWNGSAESLRVPKSSIMAEGSDSCAVLVQSGAAGPIVAGAWLRDF